jgi:putative transposase
VVTSYQKEQCLTFVQETFPKLSYAKACKLVSCSRTNKYYEKVMSEKDVVVKDAISSVIGTSRLGRRKVVVKVQKKYPDMGTAKIRRVYEKEGFSPYKRMKKRRIDNPANPIEVPLAANVEWAMDFMSDSLASGKKFRTLNIVDQYNRKCIEIGINYSLPSRKVIEILERTIIEHGKPLGIRTDNGPEFTSCLFQNWLDKNEIEWIKIQKGKPQQNAIVERFNRTYREDILDANLFFSLDHVYAVTQPWKEDYNQERPHESLNYCTPNEYAA